MQNIDLKVEHSQPNPQYLVIHKQKKKKNWFLDIGPTDQVEQDHAWGYNSQLHVFRIEK